MTMTAYRAVRTGIIELPQPGRPAPVSLFEMTRNAIPAQGGQMVTVPIGIKIRVRNAENRLYCVDAVAGHVTRESLAAPAFSGVFSTVPTPDAPRAVPWLLRVTPAGVPVTAVEPGDTISVEAEWRDDSRYAVAKKAVCTRWTPGDDAWVVRSAKTAPTAILEPVAPVQEREVCPHGVETYSGVGCPRCDDAADAPTAHPYLPQSGVWLA